MLYTITLAHWTHAHTDVYVHRFIRTHHTHIQVRYTHMDTLRTRMRADTPHTQTYCMDTPWMHIYTYLTNYICTHTLRG